MDNPYAELESARGRMVRICFTGSRDCNEKMIAFARKMVRWVMDRGWWVVVGDAMGIDRAVVLEACLYSIEKNMHITPLTVYGIADEPRNRAPQHLYLKVDLAGNKEDLSPYIFRDHIAVDDSDGYCAIWNGNTEHSGTRATFLYAQRKDKPGFVAKFKMPTAEELRQLHVSERMTDEEKAARREKRKPVGRQSNLKEMR